MIWFKNAMNRYRNDPDFMAEVWRIKKLEMWTVVERYQDDYPWMQLGWIFGEYDIHLAIFHMMEEE